MRKATHNRVEFFKPKGTVKEQERITSLEDIQKHLPLCKEIAAMYNRIHKADISAHFEGLLGWNSNAYFSLQDAEGNVKGEYVMYKSEYSLWKAGQKYVLTPKAFSTISNFKKSV